MSHIVTPPVRRQSLPTALTNSQAVTTTDDTLEAIGDTTSISVNRAPGIERNISELNAKLNALRTALQNAGVLG